MLAVISDGKEHKDTIARVIRGQSSHIPMCVYNIQSMSNKEVASYNRCSDDILLTV